MCVSDVERTGGAAGCSVIVKIGQEMKTKMLMKINWRGRENYVFVAEPRLTRLANHLADIEDLRPREQGSAPPPPPLDCVENTSYNLNSSTSFNIAPSLLARLLMPIKSFTISAYYFIATCLTNLMSIRNPAMPTSYILFLNLAFKAGFCHKIYTFCNSGFQVLSNSSRSNAYKTRAKISRISSQARFFPMQFRGPRENGSKASW